MMTGEPEEQQRGTKRARDEESAAVDCSGWLAECEAELERCRDLPRLQFDLTAVRCFTMDASFCL
jgi:hypothetical protein